MSQQFNPNQISKEMFQELLREAVARAGSISKLSMVLKRPERRIRHWMKGSGPSYPEMQRTYVKLAKLMGE